MDDVIIKRRIKSYHVSSKRTMFILRTVDTSDHQQLLAEYDHQVREALIRILGCPLPVVSVS